jgi:hypothetical protein
MAQTVNYGSNLEIVNLTLDDTTDTEILLTNKTNNILIRNRNDGDLYYRIEDGAATYLTVPTNQSLTIELGARSNSAGFLRAASAGHIAEILSMYGSGS